MKGFNDQDIRVRKMSVNRAIVDRNQSFMAQKIVLHNTIKRFLLFILCVIKFHFNFPFSGLFKVEAESRFS